MVKTTAVGFTRSDAALLAAVTEHRPARHAQKLQEFVGDVDWLNRMIPTFDEVSFGLPRLIAASYVTVERVPGNVMRLRATAKAIRLRRQIKKTARTLGDVVHGFGEALGCAPYPEPEAEDRSLGRLPEFEKDELDSAVGAWHAWFSDTFKRVPGASPHDRTAEGDR